MTDSVADDPAPTAPRAASGVAERTAIAPSPADPTRLAYPVAPHLLPTIVLREGNYEVRFARTREELDELLRLRFEIFNVELGEGLDESWRTGMDRDPFDAVCHHLIVVHTRTERIVGTYRMQTASMAADHIGFYSQGEFELGTLPQEIVGSSVEVGRACVAVEHRNTQVLFLLWRGLALYVATNQLRYFFGCCSLTSQDPIEGRAVLRYLEERDLVRGDVPVLPQPGFECWQGDNLADDPRVDAFEVKIPKLFRIYLRHGAKVCGPPAIDREFKTIDYLVLFDVAAMDEKKVRTFFG